MTLTLNLALFGRTIACRISTGDPAGPGADSYSVGADTERNNWDEPDAYDFGFRPGARMIRGGGPGR